MNPVHFEKVRAALGRIEGVFRGLLEAAGERAEPAAVVPDLCARSGELWKRELQGIQGPLDLSGADLRGGIFADDATGFLDGANFCGANLEKTRWYVTHAKRADFSGASLRECQCLMFCCEGASFRKADFTGSYINLIAVNAPVDLTEANLSKATINLNHPTPVILAGANLEGAHLTCGKPGPQLRKAVELFMGSLSETQRHQLTVDITEEKLAASAQKEKKKGGCFIATAACGSPSEPEVADLRAFRDEVLERSPAGRLFVRCYEILSPPLARWIAARAGARDLVRRGLLGPAVRFLRLPGRKGRRDVRPGE